jgi:hypothetical protein
MQKNQDDEIGVVSGQLSPLADAPEDWRIITGLPGDGVCVVDRAGRVVPYRRVQAYLTRLLEFYRRISDEEIERENGLPGWEATAAAQRLAARYLDYRPARGPRLVLSGWEKYESVKLGEGEEGFVYLLGWVGLPYYKIGQTTQPHSRIRWVAQLQPAKLEIAHLIPADRPRLAEKHLHALFRCRLVNGEYFVLHEADIEWLMSLHRLRCPYPSR